MNPKSYLRRICAEGACNHMYFYRWRRMHEECGLIESYWAFRPIEIKDLLLGFWIRSWAQADLLPAVEKLTSRLENNSAS